MNFSSVSPSASQFRSLTPSGNNVLHRNCVECVNARAILDLWHSIKNFFVRKEAHKNPDNVRTEFKRFIEQFDGDSNKAVITINTKEITDNKVAEIHLDKKDAILMQNFIVKACMLFNVDFGTMGYFFDKIRDQDPAQMEAFSVDEKKILADCMQAIKNELKKSYIDPTKEDKELKGELLAFIKVKSDPCVVNSQVSKIKLVKEGVGAKLMFFKNSADVLIDANAEKIIFIDSGEKVQAAMLLIDHLKDEITNKMAGDPNVLANKNKIKDKEAELKKVMEARKADSFAKAPTKENGKLSVSKNIEVYNKRTEEIEAIKLEIAALDSEGAALIKAFYKLRSLKEDIFNIDVDRYVRTSKNR